jgi:hypothetical protein
MLRFKDIPMLSFIQAGQAVVGLVLVLGTLLLLMQKIDVPQPLWGFDGIVIGFLYGSALTQAVQKAKNGS